VTAPEPSPPGRPGLADTLRWSGWTAVMSCILLRATVGIEPFPYWDLDPTRMQTPITGLAPAASQIVDTITMLAAATAILGEVLAGAGLLLIPTVLILFGAIGIGLHSIGPAATLDDARLGSTWLAAMLSGLAAAHLCRNDRFRRLTLAAAFGLVFLLAAKGAVQVFIEHDATVQQYRQNTEAFLRSQGWTRGSAAARNFERRLLQPEASGWFGLANVFASFAGAGLVALLGWTLLAWRHARSADRDLPDGWAGLLTIGTLAAAAALWLSGSKGGVTAAAIGLSLLAGGMILGRAARLGRLLAPPQRAGTLAVLLVLSAILAVALRGIIGTRAGELSLLFRWFYIEGAARIMADHPLVGVGPAGFKDAYMLAKPPISPEEVSSPHSIMFDFAATLGLFGLAWIGAWLGWVYRAGVVAAEAFFAHTALDPQQGDELGSPSRPLLPNSPTPRREEEVSKALVVWRPRTLRIASKPPLSKPRSDMQEWQPPLIRSHATPGQFTPERLDAWAIAAVAGIPTVVASWLETALGSPDTAMTRLLGVGGWIGIALGALALMRLAPAWRWMAAVAAIALAIHGQIEVTPVWIGSAGLFMVIVAAAGAPRPSPTRRRRTGLSLLVATGLITVGVVWASLVAPPIVRWQRHLAQAAEAVAPLADINTRLQLLQTTPGTPSSKTEALAQIVADLEALVGHPISIQGGQLDFDRALNELMVQRVPSAVLNLQQAYEAAPKHLPTVEALCRIALAGSAAAENLGRPDLAQSFAAPAEAASGVAAGWQPPTAGAAGLEGNVQSSLATIQSRPERMARALEAWKRAAALDPYGTAFPLRILRTYVDQRNAPEARSWAARLQELDKLQRLDELKRLSSDERNLVEQALRTP